MQAAVLLGLEVVGNEVSSKAGDNGSTVLRSTGEDAGLLLTLPGGPVGSRDADIDFTFTCPTTVRAVLDVLTRAGWSAAVPPGGVSYMINDVDDMYEWFDGAPDGIGEVLARLDEPGNLPYAVALNVYHPEAETGGMLMFMPGRTDVSFVPTTDRRRIPAAPEFTDLAWYLHALVPALVTAGLEGYEAKEIRY